MTPNASPVGFCRLFCRPIGLVAVVALMVTNVAAQQPQTVADWIDKASRSGERHSFVADVVYEQGSHIEALRLWHEAGDNTPLRERLSTLSGPPREILRTADSTTYLMPSASEPLAQRYSARPINLPGPDQIDRLDARYRLNTEGEGRVAGRPVQRIRLIPRDQFRYSYALWIDRQTGLVLRADVIDQDAMSVERFMIVDLEFHDNLDPELLNPVLADDSESFEQITDRRRVDGDQALVHADWSVGDLPEGFELEKDWAQMLPQRSTPVRHMLFSDGMATVSVYIERRDASERIEGPMSMGGVNIYARTQDNVQALVVGQVPMASVRRIADSLVRASDSNATGQ